MIYIFVDQAPPNWATVLLSNNFSKGKKMMIIWWIYIILFFISIGSKSQCGGVKTLIIQLHFNFNCFSFSYLFCNCILDNASSVWLQVSFVMLNKLYLQLMSIFWVGFFSATYGFLFRQFTQHIFIYSTCWITTCMQKPMWHFCTSLKCNF